ncbi:hypothetical protein BS47DRAFT_1380851 [Hydnum rufescens UP504]|uniref:F-box domain-containing protein n=1 Tax=Hydnum rufescens UP504 TaxID=1448309 RepID=A0A9P6DZ38_9AGAM|nr:hypothetical protein BS47DRAFT_1380851 [Hydnum rufescens UP504]
MLGVAVERKRAADRWSESLTRLSDILVEYKSASRHLQHLCDPRHSALLDSKFALLETLELRLARTRRGLQCVRNTSLELVPINKLHPEILSYIFQLGVEQEERDSEDVENSSYNSSNDEPEGRTFAELVSHVSRHWRAVALDTAVLWTKVDFSDPPPHEYTRILINRSKRAPLDVSFALPHADLNWPDTEYFDTVMDILGPHIPRITALTIDSPDFDDMTILMYRILQCTSTAPPLKSLVLIDQSASGHVVSSFGFSNRIPQLYELMANLRIVNFDGTRLPYSTSTFKHLTSLRLANMSSVENQPSRDEFRDILIACPMLESLILDGSGFDVDKVTNVGDGVKMISLHTLHLICIPWTDMEYALHVIEAPCLRELKIADVEEADIGDNRHHGERVLQAIQQFLTHRPPGSSSPSPLEHLHLRSTQTVEGSWPQYIPILQAAPYLRILVLYDITLSDRIIDRMGIPDGVTGARAVVCPSLETLKLCDVSNVTFSALIAMLKSRVRSGKKLEVLKVAELTPDPSGDDLETIMNELRLAVDRVVVILDGEPIEDLIT